MSSNIKDRVARVKGKPVGRYILRRGEMLTRQQLIARMHIGTGTLSAWEDAGLPSYGDGMSEKVYISDDLFDFLRTRPVRNKIRKEK